MANREDSRTSLDNSSFLTDIVSALPLDKWKFIGRRLNVGDNRIYDIETRHGDSRERTYQVLHSWKENNANANWQALVDALILEEHQTSAKKITELATKRLQDHGEDVVKDHGQEVVQDNGEDVVQDHGQEVIQDNGEDVVQDHGQEVIQDHGQEVVQEYKCIPLCYPDNFVWNMEKRSLDEIPDKSREKYVVCEEALSILETIKEQVCVVSLVGEYRSGKSYIASKLHQPLGKQCVFNTYDGMRAETRGIWMSTEPYEKKLKDGTTVKVLTFDTEGLDCAENLGSDDYRLFTLATLLSSIMIYNSTGLPKAQDLLNLSCFSALAKRIKCQMSDQDNETPVDEKSETKKFSNFFPRLVWLLRDVLRKAKLKKNGKEEIVPITEYIRKCVLTSSESADNISKEVGRAILNYFPDFQAFKLPIPTVDEDIAECMGSVDEADLNESFVQEKEKFISLIDSLIMPKKAWPKAGNVTGKRLAAMVKELVHILAAPDYVSNVHSMWTHIVRNEYEDALNKAISIYKHEMDGLIQQVMPCAEQLLLSFHETHFTKANNEFEKELVEIADTQFSAEYCKKLQNKINGDGTDKSQDKETYLQYYRQINADKSEEHCRNLARDLLEQEIFPLENDLRQRCTTFDALLQILHDVDQRYRRDARGPKNIDVYIDYFAKECMLFYENNFGQLKKLQGCKPPDWAKSIQQSCVEALNKEKEKEKDNIETLLMDSRLKETLAEVETLKKIISVETNKREEDLRSVKDIFEQEMNRLHYFYKEKDQEKQQNWEEIIFKREEEIKQLKEEESDYKIEISKIQAKLDELSSAANQRNITGRTVTRQSQTENELLQYLQGMQGNLEEDVFVSERTQQHRRQDADRFRFGCTII